MEHVGTSTSNNSECREKVAWDDNRRVGKLVDNGITRFVLFHGKQ